MIDKSIKQIIYVQKHLNEHEESSDKWVSNLKHTYAT